MVFAIDHIVIAVDDLDAAVTDYEALGFTVLPGGAHPRGSRNALICFADGAYIEIIAFSRPVPDFRWWQVLDRAGPGLVDYALLPDSLDLRLAQARAGGLEVDGPHDGSRLQPDGARLAWRWARSPGSDIPFLCEDVTPRALRVPEGAARRHANGVTGVADITVAVADAAESLARYRALLGAEPMGAAQPARFQVAATEIRLAPADAGGAGDVAAVLRRRGEGPCALRLSGPRGQIVAPEAAQGVPLAIAGAG